MPSATRGVHGGFPTAGMKLSTRLATVWRRGKTKVNRLFGHSPPEPSAHHDTPRPPTPLTLPPLQTHPSSPASSRIPYDIIEMIVWYLSRDLPTLEKCSLTCRSLSIAATPHLYHTLMLRGCRPDANRSRLEPLYRLHKLDLTRLVREIRVKQGSDSSSWLVPGAFNDLDLRYFSAFTKVHTLKIQNMQIHRFVPCIEHYFGHFSPTLRYIALYDPCCTPRQLYYFLSLFPNLDDIDIERTVTPVPATTVPGLELVPFSAPKLQGLLVLYAFSWVETWTHLINLCGGLRFRRMDLLASKSCASVLLRACAETLETLRFHARDCMAKTLNLSQLKVLRSLQFRGWAVNPSPSINNLTVLTIFSTIRSPVFSELVIIIESYSVTYLPWKATLFDTLREMNKIRPFKLVFLLDTRDCHGKARRELAEALDLVTANGFVDFLDSPPTIRVARDFYSEWDFLDFD